MMKKYLLTMPVNQANPFNHGLVEINDQGILSDGTPIEDYGFFYLSDDPLPTEYSEMVNIFIALLE